MKIRSGFVSNSSSSSFLIYGVELDWETTEKLEKKFGIDEDSDECLSDKLYDICSEVGLSAHKPCDEQYIGLSWDQVGDNETGLEFKARAKTLVAQVLGEELLDDLKFKTHEEAWHD